MLMLLKLMLLVGGTVVWGTAANKLMILIIREGKRKGNVVVV